MFGVCQCVFVSVTQSCPTLCDPMDGSLPGSSVRGILEARILEWVAIPFNRGSSQAGREPRSPALQADSLLSEPPGKPFHNVCEYKNSNSIPSIYIIVGCISVKSSSRKKKKKMRKEKGYKELLRFNDAEAASPVLWPPHAKS